ncbi:MAG: DUF86 domain-containing protein [Lachnospiraceae bacterium]|nr:DUF86 domain-containing protein [Lachnospiraceae bacterium]
MQNRIIVSKMLQYAERISEYVRGLDQQKFSESSLVIDACVFNLSQIGELVARVSKDYEKANNDIPWRQLYGLRNRIVHDYEGVNLNLVWQIVNDDIPDLIDKLKKIV